jgi:hypothetical protein
MQTYACEQRQPMGFNLNLIGLQWEKLTLDFQSTYTFSRSRRQMFLNKKYFIFALHMLCTKAFIIKITSQKSMLLYRLRYTVTKYKMHIWAFFLFLLCLFVCSFVPLFIYLFIIYSLLPAFPLCTYYMLNFNFSHLRRHVLSQSNCIKRNIKH